MRLVQYLHPFAIDLHLAGCLLETAKCPLVGSVTGRTRPPFWRLIKRALRWTVVRVTEGSSEIIIGCSPGKPQGRL